MNDEVWTHGYNSCLHVAISALNHLSSHPRPAGGQQAYNAEHLLQIADEIKRTIAHNVKVAGSVPAQRPLRAEFLDALDFLEVSATIKENTLNVPEITQHNSRVAEKAETIRLGLYALTSTDCAKER